MPRKFIITFRTSGFTLIELLLVIMILGIMSTLSISVVRQVYHTSRVEKTRMTIRKIDRVIMEMYANYDNRRVETNAGISTASTMTQEMRAQVTQAAILWCKRDLIRMEMPSNWDEVRQSDLKTGYYDANDNHGYTQLRFRIGGVNAASANTETSPLKKMYLATFKDAVERVKREKNLSQDDAVKKVYHFGSAKCLYLIVMYGNPEARELFFDHEIRTDEDGLSYFVDGWGNPIYFLRWAPGLTLSDRQPNILEPNQMEIHWDSATTKKSQAAEETPDPLDPTEVGGTLMQNPSSNKNQTWIKLETSGTSFKGWTLLPVIMSSGGVTDGNDKSDNAADFDDGFWYNFGIQMYPTNDMSNSYTINGPKVHDSVVDPFYFPLGAPLSSGANHNIIHNHTVLR
ncbi:MAG: type II secretion system GspH family protein [Planctomycetaceae bacterium]|nr:type II secretion system GspH family protein [Planctomycetaceae bacterium]